MLLEEKERSITNGLSEVPLRYNTYNVCTEDDFIKLLTSP